MNKVEIPAKKSVRMSALALHAHTYSVPGAGVEPARFLASV